MQIKVLAYLSGSITSGRKDPEYINVFEMLYYIPGNMFTQKVITGFVVYASTIKNMSVSYAFHIFSPVTQR